MISNSLVFQPVPPAPGRGDDVPASSQPIQGVPPSPGPASSPGGGFGSLFPLLIFLPLLLLMFFSNRSQKKKQAGLEEKLKTGDQVLTQAGLIGKLTEKGERYARLEIAPGVKIKVLKSTLVGLDTGEEGTKAPAAK